jgi:tetratricopeptide (TPR) repeat protein
MGFFFDLALSALGRDDDAIAAFRRAVQLEPAAGWLLSDFAWILTIARKCPEALEMAKTAIDLDPDQANPYWTAAEAATFLGDHESAIRYYERSQALSDHPMTLAALGSAYARVGRRGEAFGILEELAEMSRRRYVNPRTFAEAYLGLDSLDTAMEWLLRAAETRDPGVNLHIRHPSRDVLRSHPRYPELMRLMRLED